MRARATRGRRFRLLLGAGGSLALALAVAAAANVPIATLSTDPYTNTTSQHATEVEPDSFSFGSTIVATTQVGRFTNGGSSTKYNLGTIDGIPRYMFAFDGAINGQSLSIQPTRPQYDRGNAYLAPNNFSN